MQHQQVIYLLHNQQQGFLHKPSLLALSVNKKIGIYKLYNRQLLRVIQ